MTEIQVAQAPTLLETIANLAKDTSVPVERLSQIIELYERTASMDAEREFNVALATMQPELPTIKKTGRVEYKQTSFDYAKYDAIDAVIRPTLSKYGFSLSFSSHGSEYTVMLAHVRGHARSASLTLPADASGGKNGIQAVGSTVSYARRYLTCMILNIVTVGEDDDAMGAGAIGEEQVKEFEERIAATKSDTVRVLKHFGIQKLSDLQAKDAKELDALLKQKERQQ